MKDVARTAASALAEFDPKAVKGQDAKLDAVIDYAKRVQDWPLLEQAIDQKIEEQAKFVEYWDRNVRSDGRPKKNSFSSETVSAATLEEHGGISKVQVTRWRKRLSDPEQYRAKLYGKAWAEAFGANSERGSVVQKYTGEDEWYTPEIYVEAARRVMGSIDLDPATCPRANEVVKAAQIFTKDDDGLSQDWHGSVFLNPPYKQPLVSEFTAKLVASYQAGDVDSAILLTNNSTDTKWWQAAATACDGACFTAGRIKFYRDRQYDSPTNGQVFLYFGQNMPGFAVEFARFGFVTVPVSG